MDTFIPTKRSKAGKRFGFVRFINVFNEERLVNNLCTVWIDRYKLHANIARFHRTPVNGVKNLSKDAGGIKSNKTYSKTKDDRNMNANGTTGGGNSYVRVVKGQLQSGGGDIESVPAVVLDVELLGLSSRKSNKPPWILSLKGELLDVDDQEETCFHSKRLCIHTKSGRSILEEFKIIHRGKVYWIRANETPGWVPDFADESDDEDQDNDKSKDGSFSDHEPGCGGGDTDVEEVPKTLFEEDGQVNNNLENEHMEKQEDKSEDPFNIYPLLNKNNNMAGKDNKSEGSLKYPHGFTPQEGTDANTMHAEGNINDNVVDFSDCKMHGANDVSSGNRFKVNSKEDSAESAPSGHFKKSVIPRTGGSILGILDEVVKVGQVMGYKMDGCMSNMAEIIESQGVDENFLLIAVYAPHDGSEKLLLWDYLHRVIGKWRGEVVIMGDFNEVRYKSDRFGLVFNAHGANVFNSFIMNSGLVEITLGGSSFTWCHKSARKMSKLDRFLVSESLLSMCLNINAITLELYISDHRPILLREAHFDYGPTPFRFFHYWFEMDGFCKIMEDTWRESPCEGSNAMRRMMGKLKFLKDKIREWNKTNMLSVKNIKAQYKIDLEAVDSIIDNGNGTAEDVKKKVEIVNKLQGIDKLNSLEVAQKAKVKWAVEGHENSSFFHGMLNKKRNLLNIRGVLADGFWIDNPNKVKREFLDHFSNRFCKPGHRRAILQMSFPKSLSSYQQRELESEVTNDEIKRAVWDCGTDKASGPDGFTFGFYQRFWYLIESDVYDAVRYFFTYDDIPKGCNSSFIALIPKIPDANLVKDFRPISLVGSLYKIIAKILANRLVGVFGDLVSDVQSAFIADRQILYGPFILNEVLEWCKVKQMHALIYMVDFEKAYDSVRLDFLNDVLIQRRNFNLAKGLNKEIVVSVFVHLDHGKPSFIVSTCGGCGASGLKINMSKSKIMGVHVNSVKVKRVALKLGCLVLKPPFLYLGSSVGGSMSRTHAWSEVVDRVKKRLSKWKMKTLSIGGRLTLLKSVLGSLKSLRASWVNWKKVLDSKESGGLGVSSLYALNRGLMFKWIWRFHMQESSLWVRVIKAIHGVNGKIGETTRAGTRSCWINFIHEVNASLNKGIDLMNNMRIKLGNGMNTAFWEDTWSEGGKLKNRYPHMYALESCKSISVGLKLAQPSLAFSFRRAPRRGAEQEQFDEVVDLVNAIKLAPVSDRWTWALESSGDFSVASVRKLIDDKLLPVVDYKTRWIKFVPIKVNVHAWKVMSDSLPTRFNISRCGICIDNIRCVICDKGVETSSHLFFSCCMVRQVICLISRWWGVTEVEFESYDGWLAWLVNLRLPYRDKLMLEGVFYVMWWLL
nr:RNA-directed DNA polymerase, eukaryota, reverse transcriptase zinc-binding domain protein [Tanacetum cinerariifolium]